MGWNLSIFGGSGYRASGIRDLGPGVEGLWLGSRVQGLGVPLAFALVLRRKSRPREFDGFEVYGFGVSGLEIGFSTFARVRLGQTRVDEVGGC